MSFFLSPHPYQPWITGKMKHRWFYIALNLLQSFTFLRKKSNYIKHFPVLIGWHHRVHLNECECVCRDIMCEFVRPFRSIWSYRRNCSQAKVVEISDLQHEFENRVWLVGGKKAYSFLSSSWTALLYWLLIRLSNHDGYFCTAYEYWL